MPIIVRVAVGVLFTAQRRRKNLGCADGTRVLIGPAKCGVYRANNGARRHGEEKRQDDLRNPVSGAEAPQRTLLFSPKSQSHASAL